VFTETSKFKEAQDRYQAEVAKLVRSRHEKRRRSRDQAGNPHAVDKACDSCHDNFREGNDDTGREDSFGAAVRHCSLSVGFQA
jgi:cytochrome c556